MQYSWCISCFASFGNLRVYLYQPPAVSVDSHYGKSSYMLSIAQVSGELLNPMWKLLNPPSMLPTEMLHIKVSSVRRLHNHCFKNRAKHLPSFLFVSGLQRYGLE